MKPTHIAILGRQPELGLVELESLVGAAAMAPFGRSAALLDRILPIDSLGGTVKIGQIIYEGPTTDLQELPIAFEQVPRRDGKTTFALSVYGARAASKAVVAAGLALKRRLREQGSVRYVAPKDGTEVSAAQLKFNRVLEEGFELLVVIDRQRMILALTEGVQDIDWYSQRDYDRPARSAKVGMLPPKLAQILVNTTSAPVVVDPFCGTGVVLQEALLLGRTVVGSDLALEMVAASRQNLAWLEHERPEVRSYWTVQEPEDARMIRLPDLACSVVSEGYLGPNLPVAPSVVQLAEIKKQLRELYQETLANWAHQLDSGAELALCVPAWRLKNGWSYLEVVDDLAGLGYTRKVFKHVATPLLYARDDQVVGRQLMLVRKI